MKQLFLLAILFPGLLHIPSMAQSRSSPQSSTEGMSLLWRIDKSGAKTSWLFGTMHMICAEDYIWTAAMEEALLESETVCMEMDMGDPTILMQVTTGLIDTSGKTLRDYFTPEQYALLEQYVKDSLQSSLALFDRMKPIALQALFLTQSDLCPSFRSYEQELTLQAKQHNKGVAGLETPAEQLAIINNLPTDSVVAAIMDMIDNPGSDWDAYRELTTLYRSQDLAGLHNQIALAKGMDGIMNIFLDDRNQKWITTMKELMDTQSVFFAVGAGHLWGENGLITLLRNNGYTITQVN